MTVRKGEPWGEPAEGPPDLEVSGDDSDLARAVAGVPGALVRFRADAASDIARAVGLAPGRVDAATAVPMDALAYDDGALAVNALVLGTAPDRLRRFTRSMLVRVTVDGRDWVDGRATTVVVATGQFLRGTDLVPRGHPGDGRAEVQVYQLRAGERAGMRRRLPRGEHLPHPRILHRSGHRVEVEVSAAVSLEADGRASSPVARLAVDLVPCAYRLLL